MAGQARYTALLDACVLYPLRNGRPGSRKSGSRRLNGSALT